MTPDACRAICDQFDISTRDPWSALTDPEKTAVRKAMSVVRVTSVNGVSGFYERLRKGVRRSGKYRYVPNEAVVKVEGYEIDVLTLDDLPDTIPVKR